MKEPEIKLFGRMILLPENAGECSDGSSDQEQKMQAEEDQSVVKDNETKSQDKNQIPSEAEESQNPDTSSLESDEDLKTPSIDEDIASTNNIKTETEQSESLNEQQKTLKKPDKILPCPRCNSMDTKFCYYNNYNVNQPRHFCKSCQRYWTAGGTMRNVPVGSGRRKNKNTSSSCHHITINEALQASRIDAARNGFDNPSFRPNGTVLSFGPDPQLCESMPLNLPDKRSPNGVKNGRYYAADQTGSASCKMGDNNKDDCSLGSPSLTNGVIKNGFPSHVPCVPWPIPWNSYPIPAFYPPPYYTCAMPNAWNVPWLSLPNQMSPNSALGKHSRNGELIKPNVSEGKDNAEQKSLESSIVVPKTLRIDDPKEAAKSSIWETLGIKYDSIQRECLFKALQPKCDEKKSFVSNSSVIQANPAALSRSINFQEGV